MPSPTIKLYFYQTCSTVATVFTNGDIVIAGSLLSLLSSDEVRPTDKLIEWKLGPGEGALNPHCIAVA